jgi:hypothetical protein
VLQNEVAALGYDGDQKPTKPMSKTWARLRCPSLERGRQAGWEILGLPGVRRARSRKDLPAHHDTALVMARRTAARQHRHAAIDRESNRPM